MPSMWPTLPRLLLIWHFYYHVYYSFTTAGTAGRNRTDNLLVGSQVFFLVELLPLDARRRIERLSIGSKPMILPLNYPAILDAPVRFERTQTESESVVLPLDDGAMCVPKVCSYSPAWQTPRMLGKMLPVRNTMATHGGSRDGTRTRIS